MLGSAMVHMHIGNGLHNLLYSADMKFARTRLLEPAECKFPRLETLMIESTYGGKDNVLPFVKDQDEMLKQTVKDTVARKGKILIPTLGSGRAQEIMMLIEEMVRTNEIEPISVYIDGMVWDITAIHTAYPEFLSHLVRKQIFHKDNNPFLSPIFKRVGSNKERQQVIEETGSCIVIATSGMLVGGPSVEYLKAFCDNPHNTLIFSCYQQEGSIGKRIREGEKEIVMSVDKTGKPEVLNIKMEVTKIEITGHSDRRELMNFLQHCMPKPRKVIINHGENSRCLDLASSIHKMYRVETVAPRNLEAVRIR
jgi:predicted metal-dependent RNase